MQRAFNFLNILWFKGLKVSDNISERDLLAIIKQLCNPLSHVHKTQTVLNMEQSAVKIDHYLLALIFAFALIMVFDILYYKAYFFALVIAILYSFLDSLWGSCAVQKTIEGEDEDGPYYYTSIVQLCGDRTTCRDDPAGEINAYCACK